MYTAQRQLNFAYLSWSLNPIEVLKEFVFNNPTFTVDLSIVIPFAVKQDHLIRNVVEPRPF